MVPSHIVSIVGFIEKMCLLGYPRLISRDNFLSTNFPLVAEILHWFCERLDPSHGISMNIDTEQDRVNFIASAVQYLVHIFTSFMKG